MSIKLLLCLTVSLTVKKNMQQSELISKEKSNKIQCNYSKDIDPYLGIKYPKPLTKGGDYDILSSPCYNIMQSKK